LRVKWGF